MAEPFLGEIRITSFDYAPSGWALCNGQLLPVNQNAALFSLIGTSFGGDGRSTFGLPNLQGRVPMHDGPGQNPGVQGGESQHTLTLAEMAGHTHQATARDAPGNSSSPAGTAWAQQPDNQMYTSVVTSSLVTMNPSAIAPAGSGQPHENWSPYVVVSFMIALSGLYPSRP
ncbi:MAG TPA: tail fiber protein [Polyangia bacterium]|jgi:microcystin-dependent protein